MLFPAASVFLKLDRRVWFFDEAGWIEIGPAAEIGRSPAAAAPGDRDPRAGRCLTNISIAMTLAERIDADLKDAMRARDAARLGVLRMFKSALKYAAIEKAGAEGELDDAEATQVIRKQVKQRQDSIESFEKGGRAELAEKEKAELALLNQYLPAAMSAEDLGRLVRETIAETGATSRRRWAPS